MHVRCYVEWHAALHIPIHKEQKKKILFFILACFILFRLSFCASTSALWHLTLCASVQHVSSYTVVVVVGGSTPKSKPSTSACRLCACVTCAATSGAQAFRSSTPTTIDQHICVCVVYYFRLLVDFYFYMHSVHTTNSNNPPRSTVYYIFIYISFGMADGQGAEAPKRTKHFTVCCIGVVRWLWHALDARIQTHNDT